MYKEYEEMKKKYPIHRKLISSVVTKINMDKVTSKQINNNNNNNNNNNGDKLKKVIKSFIIRQHRAYMYQCLEGHEKEYVYFLNFVLQRKMCCNCCYDTLPTYLRSIC